MNSEKILKVVANALDDIKAKDIITLNVKGLTSITDVIIVCSGTSTRHVKAIKDRILEYSAKEKIKPLGVEGEQEGEWVLVDLNEVIIHIMMPEIRSFYQLEKLWDIEPKKTKGSSHEN